MAPGMVLNNEQKPALYEDQEWVNYIASGSFRPSKPPAQPQDLDGRHCFSGLEYSLVFYYR